MITDTFEQNLRLSRPTLTKHQGTPVCLQLCCWGNRNGSSRAALNRCWKIHVSTGIEVPTKETLILSHFSDPPHSSEHKSRKRRPNKNKNWVIVVVVIFFFTLRIRVRQVSDIGGHEGKHHEHSHDPYGEQEQHERRRRQWGEYQRQYQQGRREPYQQAQRFQAEVTCRQQSPPALAVGKAPVVLDLDPPRMDRRRPVMDRRLRFRHWSSGHCGTSHSLPAFHGPVEIRQSQDLFANAAKLPQTLFFL